jgi:energy-coupling factor transporter ATP-binding protein EcfA2
MWSKPISGSQMPEIRDLNACMARAMCCMASASTLLGRNGAGKSTTLKSIMGLVGQRTGSIRFQGEELIAGRSDPSRAGALRIAPRSAASTQVSVSRRTSCPRLGSSPLRSALPPKADICGPARLRLLGAKSYRRVRVGNALEASQWNGATEGLPRLSREHPVWEWRLELNGDLVVTLLEGTRERNMRRRSGVDQEDGGR